MYKGLSKNVVVPVTFKVESKIAVPLKVKFPDTPKAA